MDFILIEIDFVYLYPQHTRIYTHRRYCIVKQYSKIKRLDEAADSSFKNLRRKVAREFFIHARILD